jgi:hypothetical protein
MSSWLRVTCAMVAQMSDINFGLCGAEVLHRLWCGGLRIGLVLAVTIYY